MKKICKVIKNWLFLCRFSWEINKVIFFTEGLRAVLDIVEPFVILIFPKFILDELTYGKQWDKVLYYILIFMGVQVLLQGIRLVLQPVRNGVVNHTDVKNGMHYVRHFLNTDYSRLEDSEFRDFQGEVRENVHSGVLVIDGLRETMTALFRLGGYGYLILTLHPFMLAVVFGVAVLNYFLSERREKNDYEVQAPLASQTRRFEYLFQTMSQFEYAKEVRINQAADWLSAKYLKLLDSHKKLYIKFQNKQLIVKILEMSVSFLQMAFLYGYAAYEAVTGQVTVGDFSVYIGAVLGFSGAFTGVVGKLPWMAYKSRYADEYKKYLKMARPSHLDKGVLGLPESENGHYTIEFKDVSFRYPNTESMVLNHISLKITQGEKLSVVGINGAGKTTFIKLLCRLYEPTEGAILYNGIDISTIRMEDYMPLLSVVFQDFKLFAFSMEENIVLNRPLEKERVMDAVNKSGLEEKINSLKAGLDTPVSREFDEEGVEFSGGEGQKLVTARAYYRNAPVVILDEPTAALDPMSESRVYSRFREIMQDKTAIFISHRLASARFCDRIAVFREGKIVEYGTHEELMAREGLYHTMFQKQAEYYQG